MDIITGLREETHWLTETLLRRNLQNCEATRRVQSVNISSSTNTTYV